MSRDRQTFARTPTDTTPNLRRDTDSKRPTPLLTHFIILTSILTPVALLPFLLLRSRLASLNRKITEIGTANAKHQKDTRLLLRGNANHNKDMKAMMEKTHLSLLWEARRRASGEERIRHDLKEILSEKQNARTQAETLRDLGISLADIAAFMQEVEIKHGFVPKKDDGRGIERIRQMALRLQKMVKGEDKTSAPEVESKTRDDHEGGSEEPQAQTETKGKNEGKT